MEESSSPPPPEMGSEEFGAFSSPPPPDAAVLCPPPAAEPPPLSGERLDSLSIDKEQIEVFDDFFISATSELKDRQRSASLGGHSPETKATKKRKLSADLSAAGRGAKATTVPFAYGKKECHFIEDTKKPVSDMMPSSLAQFKAIRDSKRFFDIGSDSDSEQSSSARLPSEQPDAGHSHSHSHSHRAAPPRSKQRPTAGMSVTAIASGGIRAMTPSMASSMSSESATTTVSPEMMSASFARFKRTHSPRKRGRAGRRRRGGRHRRREAGAGRKPPPPKYRKARRGSLSDSDISSTSVSASAYSRSSAAQSESLHDSEYQRGDDRQLEQDADAQDAVDLDHEHVPVPPFELPDFGIGMLLGSDVSTSSLATASGIGDQLQEDRDTTAFMATTTARLKSSASADSALDCGAQVESAISPLQSPSPPLLEATQSNSSSAGHLTDFAADGEGDAVDFEKDTQRDATDMKLVSGDDSSDSEDITTKDSLSHTSLQISAVPKPKRKSESDSTDSLKKSKSLISSSLDSRAKAHAFDLRIHMRSESDRTLRSSLSVDSRRAPDILDVSESISGRAAPKKRLSESASSSLMEALTTPTPLSAGSSGERITVTLTTKWRSPLKRKRRRRRAESASDVLSSPSMSSSSSSRSLSQRSQRRRGGLAALKPKTVGKEKFKHRLSMKLISEDESQQSAGEGGHLPYRSRGLSISVSRNNTQSPATSPIASTSPLDERRFDIDDYQFELDKVATSDARDFGTSSLSPIGELVRAPKRKAIAPAKDKKTCRTRGRTTAPLRLDSAAESIPVTASGTRAGSARTTPTPPTRRTLKGKSGPSLTKASSDFVEDSGRKKVKQRPPPRSSRSRSPRQRQRGASAMVTQRSTSAMRAKKPPRPPPKRGAQTMHTGATHSEDMRQPPSMMLSPPFDYSPSAGRKSLPQSVLGSVSVRQSSADELSPAVSPPRFHRGAKHSPSERSLVSGSDSSARSLSMSDKRSTRPSARLARRFKLSLNSGMGAAKSTDSILTTADSDSSDSCDECLKAADSSLPKRKRSRTDVALKSDTFRRDLMRSLASKKASVVTRVSSETDLLHADSRVDGDKTPMILARASAASGVRTLILSGIRLLGGGGAAVDDADDDEFPDTSASKRRKKKKRGRFGGIFGGGYFEEEDEDDDDYESDGYGSGRGRDSPVAGFFDYGQEAEGSSMKTRRRKRRRAKAGSFSLFSTGPGRFLSVAGSGSDDGFYDSEMEDEMAFFTSLNDEYEANMANEFQAILGTMSALRSTSSMGDEQLDADGSGVVKSESLVKVSELVKARKLMAAMGPMSATSSPIPASAVELDADVAVATKGIVERTSATLSASLSSRLLTTTATAPSASVGMATASGSVGEFPETAEASAVGSPKKGLEARKAAATMREPIAVRRLETEAQIVAHTEAELLHALMLVEVMSPSASASSEGSAKVMETMLISVIEKARSDVLAPFLPHVAFRIYTNASATSKLACGRVLSQRIQKELDLKQHVTFLLSSYGSDEKLKVGPKKVNPVKVLFAGMVFSGETLPASAMLETRFGSLSPKQSMTKLTYGVSAAESSEATDSSSEDSEPFTPVVGMDMAVARTKQKTGKAAALSAAGRRRPALEEMMAISPASAARLLPMSDVVKFWEFVVRHKACKRPGFEIGMGPPLRHCIIDPCAAGSKVLSRVSIRKVIASNAKPLLVDLYVGSARSSSIILKDGDDLRKDSCVMQMFKFFNHIWREEGVDFGGVFVSTLCYKVIPMTAQFGAIELINGCIPLRHVSQLGSVMTAKRLRTLITTAAGSYIASFVMGARDRHFDNILVRQTDCTLFHIDFNYVLGAKVSFDACPFGITKDLYKIMGDDYTQFVILCGKAYAALRKHSQRIVAFAQLLFSPHLCSAKALKNFIKAKLRVKDSKYEAWLRKQLTEAPFNKQTKWKNRIHKMATDRMKL